MILFDKIIFGPIHSRRLGLSLGVNLLPLETKICNFDCIYCECGLTNLKPGIKKQYHKEEDVLKNLEAALVDLRFKKIDIDSITFAGNGEPTMHPQFDKIVDGVILLRDRYFKKSKVSVFSNAALLNNKRVVDSLLKMDLPILKLDSAIEKTFFAINRPVGKRSLRWIIDHLLYFKGKLIIQTMFLRYNIDNIIIDNTSEEEVSAWLKVLREIKPEMVMIYSLDRETPLKGMEKISISKLDEIALKVNQIGIKTMVS